MAVAFTFKIFCFNYGFSVRLILEFENEFPSPRFVIFRVGVILETNLGDLKMHKINLFDVLYRGLSGELRRLLRLH